MIKKKLNEFPGGCLAGNFKESLIENPNFEVGIKKIKRGFVDIPHYHLGGKEYNLLITGKVKHEDQVINQDSIFIFEVGEISAIKAIEDSVIMVFRGYSDPKDKYEK